MLILNALFLHFLLFFLGASIAFSQEAPPSASAPLPTPEQKTQWVQDWKNLKDVSRQNRQKACTQIEALSWAAEFPFPKLIEERKALWCRQAPEYSTKSFDDLLKVSRFHRNDFKPALAQKFLTRAMRLAKTKAQKIEALEDQLKLDRASQNKKKRQQTAKKLADLDPDKFLVDYARTLWTFDQTGLAIRTLQSAEKKFKKSSSLQEVYFVLGRIQEERKNNIQALAFYDKALKEPRHSVDVLTKVLAFAAWVNQKEGQLELAADYWNKLFEESPERFTKSRALYWRSFCEFKLGKKDDSQKTLKRIITDDPISYYALLAHRDLKLPLKPLTPFQESEGSFQKLKILTVEEKNFLGWLVAFDEKDLAERVLLENWNAALKLKGQDQAAYFQQFWQLSLTNALIRALNQLPANERLELTEKYQAALFPYHFEKEILAASLEEKVDPYFVMALIRQESAFNPEARSPTDAVGLMQVMPSLAKKIAAQKKLKFTRTSELFDPVLNLKIGTRELQDRLQDFDGNQFLAAASYNAGVAPVKGWLKTRHREDPVEFIEEIPFEETRGYVRLIIRNELFYRRLFSKEPFLFPEDILTKGWVSAPNRDKKTGP